MKLQNKLGPVSRPSLQTIFQRQNHLVFIFESFSVNNRFIYILDGKLIMPKKDSLHMHFKVLTVILRSKQSQKLSKNVANTWLSEGLYRVSLFP